MDFINIALLFVVTVCVTVFIILDALQESRKTRKLAQAKKPEVLLADQDTNVRSVGAEITERGCQCDEVDDVEERSSGLGVSGNTGVIEDDWEGIERTDLEKMFGKAVVYVNSQTNAARFDGPVFLKLYGLQKVALEGPCRDSQPMALKLSARSKWNAWKKLGDMRRETAMEEYIEVLSTEVPEWKGEVSEVLQDAGSFEAAQKSITSYNDGAGNDM